MEVSVWVSGPIRGEGRTQRPDSLIRKEEEEGDSFGAEAAADTHTLENTHLLGDAPPVQYVLSLRRWRR